MAVEPRADSAPEPPLSPRPPALEKLRNQAAAPRAALQWLRGALGYAVALISVAATAFLHAYLLQPVLGSAPTLLLLFVLPVLLTAYVGTQRQALFATLIAAIISVFSVLEPQQSFYVREGEDRLGLLLYLFVGVAVSVMSGRLKAADVKAREAGIRLEAALLGGKIGTWTWRLPDGHLIGDRNLAKLLEITEAEATQGSLDIFLRRTHPDDVAHIRERINAAVERRDDFVVPEARIFARDNSIRWLSARGRLQLTPEGVPESLNGIVIDITDRKLAEEELRRSEEQLRLLTDALPVLIAYVDRDGRYRYNNKAYEVWHNVRREDLHGRTLEQVVGSKGYAAIEPYVEAALRGERVTYETTVTYNDGETRYVRGEYIPHVQPDGAVDGFYALVEDLSAFKAAESALRASEARFRTMADQAPVLIWLSGPDGGVTWFNRPWLEFTGRHLEDELGVGWMEGLHPEDRARINAAEAHASAYRQPFKWEYRLCRHDGQFRWLLDHGVPIRDEKGQFNGYVGSCIDITERRQMEEALRQADRRKDEFLATLAHELRNPLAPIRQAARLARSGHTTAEQLNWSYEVIDRQVQHMALLLDDLLDVSRITRGTLALRRQILDVAQVVASAIETARPLIDARRHELTVDVPPDTPRLYADPLRIAQVLSNLLTNAAKYTEAGGRIHLQVSVNNAEVAISVADNGAGIAPEMLARVFEMFSQAKSTLKNAEGGLGIGLALARGLIALHGGSIEARSAGLGKGSEFIVRLPRDADVTTVPGELPATDATCVTPRRVLVADDNVDAAESLSMLMTLEGHEVRTAHDGSTAIALAEAFRPEVLLLDIGMPDLNGYEVATRLRALPWARDVLMIAITGWGQEQDRRRSRDAGFDHHLTKPIDPDVVTRLMK